jgi:hypothetical protein
MATDPAILFGGGTWVRFGQGKMLVSQNGADVDFDTAEEVGGAKSVTLATANLPAHTHDQGTLVTAGAGSHNHVPLGGGSFIRSTGGAQSTNGSGGTVSGIGYTDTVGNHAHTISGDTGATGSGTAVATLSPYIVVYMWKRTG